jgi:hypothetical protein
MAMRVAREVRENGFGSAERLLRIDHPFRSPEQDEEGGERIDIGERCVPAAKLESAGRKTKRRNSRDSTRTAKKKFGRQAIHLVPSSDSPPPGTIMCTQ